MNEKFTFSKKEKLSYKRHIDSLFSEGKSFTLNQLKVFYRIPDDQEDFPARVLIAIPSKKFKRAVDRNRLRRVIREAYRLNKHRLAQLPKHIHLGYVYIGSSADIPFNDIESGIIASMEKLVKLVPGDTPA